MYVCMCVCGLAILARADSVCTYKSQMTVSNTFALQILYSPLYYYAQYATINMPF